MKRFNVAVVGATGAVGMEMASILGERRFPLNEIKFLASERSLGREILFDGKPHPVEVLNEGSFTGIDIGLFSPGGSVSQKYAPIAAAAGCVVIDNTSA